jgi:hypothetical protein
MVRGGVPTLPYIIDEIEKGDVSLLLAVELIKTPKPFPGSSARGLSKNATRANCLNWWNENKHKWLIFNPNEGNPSDR